MSNPQDIYDFMINGVLFREGNKETMHVILTPLDLEKELIN